MSDYIQIVETNGGMFEVSTCDDSNWHELIGIASALKEAVLMAKKYIEEKKKAGFSMDDKLAIYFNEKQKKVKGE